MEQYPHVDESSPARRKYLVAMYWSISTVTTLSYGDIFPHTDLEKVFIMIAMVVGAATYAYIIGGICGILTQINARESAFNQAMDSLNSFLKEKARGSPLRLHGLA